MSKKKSTPKSELTQERLKELLDYDPESGVFTNRISRSSKARKGDVCGSEQPSGYLTIGLDFSTYLCSRLAWLYVYGCFPNCNLRYINGNKLDNRIANLREDTGAGGIPITQELLRAMLTYDRDSGVFINRINRGGNAHAGDEAGCLVKGYVYINLLGKKYLAHRLAWLYENGEMPNTFIDHVNGIPSDNRIANLRKANQAENMQNIRSAKSSNKCGLLGASYNSKDKRWVAQIRVDGVKKFLGGFSTPEEAHRAYIQAKVAHHPFQTIVPT